MTGPHSSGPRALLTGGTGFLGGRVARDLLDDGWSVTLLCRRTSDLGGLARLGITDRVHIERLGDVDLLTELGKALDSARPDVVVHLAAQSRGQESPARVAEMLHANVTMPSLLLAAAHERGVRFFLNAGTSWQTASVPTFAPFNVYAATKQAFEDMLVAYVVDGLCAVTLRLFDTYGPGDLRRKVVDQLADAARDGTTLKMSPGEQVIDLVHIDDAARAFAVAARRLQSGNVAGHEIYGIGDTRMSLRELARLVGVAVGRPVPIEWGGRPYRPREVMNPSSHLPRLPGWTPRVPLAEGLRDAFGAAVA